MTGRIDHATEAVKHIAGVHDWQADEGITDATLLASALIAQAEATLALVAQQRLTNLVAYVQLLETQYAEARRHGEGFDWSTHEASVARHTAALIEIRKGLGL